MSADTITRPETSALDVLRAGQCSAACLLGETTRCHCRCGGTHHGELAAAILRQAETTTAGPTRAARRRARKGRRA